MKKIALYIVLLSYSLVIIKPVSPYFSDAVAHIFYYTQHMATVHYEDGSFHVHKEVMEKSAQSEKQQEVPASKKNNSGTDHLSQPEFELLRLYSVVLKAPVFNSNPLPDCFTGEMTPPPRI